MKISACLITKNEENNIARCIESFRKAVHEIIVVDTGSTDETVNMAEKLGARVFHYQWDNNFSNARNYALDKARGDWVVFLDADEYFFADTAQNIPKAIQLVHKNRKIDGILCKFYHLADETLRVICTDFLPRIYRKDRKVRYVGSIHEKVMRAGVPVITARVPEWDLKVYHTGYVSDIISTKLERNLQLLLDEMENGQADHYTYFYLSDCYLGLLDYEQAIKFARLFLSNGQSVAGITIKAHLNIINSMINTNYPTEDISVEIDAALEKFPRHPDFYWKLAVLRFGEQNYRKALSAIELTLKYGLSYDDIAVSTFTTDISPAFYHMGLIYGCQNDEVKAVEAYVKALQSCKYYSEAFMELGELIRNEKPEDIILLLRSLYSENNVSDMEFVVRRLTSLKMPTVLMYYSNLLLKIHGKEDISLVFSLFLNGKYDEAFNYFYEMHHEPDGEWLAPYAVASALMTGNEEKISLIRCTVRPPLQRLLDLYSGCSQNGGFSSDHLEDYLHVLSEMAFHVDEREIQSIINLKRWFMEDVSDKIGDMFLDHKLYRYAIEQYKDAILSNSSERGPLHYKLGICLYKLRDYSNAVAAFDLALKDGNKNKGIFEFLHWCNEQCESEEVRRLIDRINHEQSRRDAGEEIADKYSNFNLQ